MRIIIYRKFLCFRLKYQDIECVDYYHEKITAYSHDLIVKQKACSFEWLFDLKKFTYRRIYS